MKRVMILGCCGAGKSTLGEALHQITGLELIPLDQHYFQGYWVEPPPEQWAKTVQQLTQKEQWIIDGNYGGTLDLRLAKADTIILLRYPTATCLRRVLLRTWKYYGKARPGMPSGCTERFSLSFLHYVALFNRIKLPGLLKQLKTVEKEKNVYILSNDQEVQDFLTQVGA